MASYSRRSTLLLLAASLAVPAACGGRDNRNMRTSARNAPNLYPNETPELRVKINRWADHYNVPRELVHRVIQRESDYRPSARNGPYIGLMQIHPRTAQGMGYQGSAEGLLDADTNLQYAVKYLRGAWMVSDGSQDRAIGWYARGYYYEAKKRGLLVQTGLKT